MHPRSRMVFWGKSWLQRPWGFRVAPACNPIGWQCCTPKSLAAFRSGAWPTNGSKMFEKCWCNLIFVVLPWNRGGERITQDVCVLNQVHQQPASLLAEDILPPHMSPTFLHISKLEGYWAYAVVVARGVQNLLWLPSKPSGAETLRCFHRPGWLHTYIAWSGAAKDLWFCTLLAEPLSIC